MYTIIRLEKAMKFHEQQPTDHHKLLKESIKDQFELIQHTREKISDATFQLIISQMDFLKTIASLVIGVAAISYFYDENNLDKMFLLLAFVF